MFTPCKHRWQSVNKVFKDRFNWVTIQKCRKCNRKEQTTYRVDVQENMKTTCFTERIEELGLNAQETG